MNKKKIAEEIRKTNEEFHLAPRKEKRMMIAKDVIKAITSNVIIPQAGQYSEVSGYGDKNNALDAILTPSAECRVCAIGSMFTTLLFRDSLMNTRIRPNIITSIESGISMKFQLLAYFDSYQAAMIECAFERLDSRRELFNCTDTQMQDSIYFGNEYIDSEERLIAIMQNIIDNNGDFIP